MTTTPYSPNSLGQVLVALRARLPPVRPTDPVEVQGATERAFSRFAASWGSWSDSLFDRHFLAHHGAGILVAFATGELSQASAAEALAVAWDRQFGGQLTERRRRRLAELMPAVSAFLGWVADEMPPTAQEGPGRAFR